MHTPTPNRYSLTPSRRSGRSGLILPAVSLGLWHNFGGNALRDNSRAMLTTAFDLGVFHFDLANNYGPPPGSAEETLGAILRSDLMLFRDELIISTKAGYTMWPGPHGDRGSRKYLLASLDQSLRRMGLDYVDIFYHHRPDPDTPLEESMLALDQAVRSGKAIYAAISNYPADLARAAAKILRELKTPFVLHQPSYSMLNRWIEDGLLDAAGDEGFGVIAFSPLAQGVLSGKYMDGIPADSRAGKGNPFLANRINPAHVEATRRLLPIAQARGQSLAQLALAWALRDTRVTSVLIGASSPAQIAENAAAANNTVFTAEELAAIETALRG